MNLEELINELDELILGGMALPMSGGKCVINREKAKEIIADLRLNLPTEIKQAKDIVTDRNEIITKAREEADEITGKAKALAEKMLQQNEITQMATEKATEMLNTAQVKSKELRTAASNYTEDLMGNLEEFLTKSLSEVKQARQFLKDSE
ncbi:MAG: ATPase [Eubacteriales bacterium]|jgi:hypothetical protein